jgi:signal transduction histidine kinase
VKIRTKLVLLLSTALVVTMAVSTVLRIRWTRTRLEAQLQQSAQDTAEAIAADLQKRLPSGANDDDINEELKNVKLRHPVSYLELSMATDEDTISTFSLASHSDEPQVARRASARTKTGAQRREDARRALADHGDSSRRPGHRATEPMWRTPDHPESSRWPSHVAPAPQAPLRVAHTFQEGQRGRDPVLEVQVPFDPDGEGPRHGELTVSVSREPIEQVLRNEWLSSVLITGGAVLLLMLMMSVVIDRIVGRPVSDLQLAMQRVDSGAMDVRVEARRPDELGTLSRGFNVMIDRLARTDADMRGFNRRLADEVKAATLDLARKNEALGQLNRLLVEARRELGDKERLAALGQLAAQLAHEIGTPLGSVSGHLQLAMTGRDVPQPLKERLLVATRELERVSKIVRDYLDSTRRVKPEPVTVNVRRLIEESLDIALGAERRARIRVASRVDDEAVELFTDPGLLRQILVNLCTNAADALPQEGGHITVAARREDGVVHVSVADDGSGISREDASRIFEPFYTTKGRGKGTGLGLAICREIAGALGGRISVESEPGHGSTFTITLPRESARNAA